MDRPTVDPFFVEAQPRSHGVSILYRSNRFPDTGMFVKVLDNARLYVGYVSDDVRRVLSV